MTKASSLLTLARSAVFNAYFFGLTTVLGLCGLCVRAFARERSLDLAMLWARLVLAGARHICGMRIVVLGREYLPTGPAVIASQHQSTFDTLVWLTLVPRASYVLKRELRRMPLFGPLLRPAGQIAIDRGAGAAALRSLLREGERAASENRQIIIFPEGTRVEPGRRVPLQPGVAALASRLGLPVVPVATDSGRHWGRRAFQKRPGTIHVAVLPPIAAGAKRPELLRLVEERWASARIPDVPPPPVAVDNSVDKVPLPPDKGAAG